MYQKFINFLKKYGLYDDKIFHYIMDNAVYFDYLDDELRSAIGVYCIYQQNKLFKIVTYVPYITDDKTVLINVHEYVHAFLLYSKLGTKYKMGMDCEVLPFYFENLYILENPNIGLEEFEQRWNQSISYENREEYRIAYTLQKDLLQ